ncbi:MAG: hypothetical protein FWE62_03455 [Firmicutes bacterium]|nr:hypothetical protein [Bacillota bacterium]
MKNKATETTDKPENGYGYNFKKDDLNFKQHPTMDGIFFLLKKSGGLLLFALMFSLMGIVTIVPEDATGFAVTWRVLLSVIFIIPVYFLCYTMGKSAGAQAMTEYIKGLKKSDNASKKSLLVFFKEFKPCNGAIFGGAYVLFVALFFVLGLFTWPQFKVLTVALNFPAANVVSALGLDLLSFGSPFAAINLIFVALPPALYAFMYFIGGKAQENQQYAIESEVRDIRG